MTQTDSPRPQPALPPAPPWNRASMLQAAGFVAAAAAYLATLQFLTPVIVETDGYYHIKVADLIRQRGILREFPWAAFSLWTERFFDKDFLFHLLLAPFTLLGLVTGAKVAAVFFGTLFFASFFLVLRRTGVRHPWFFALVLLLGSGGYFGWRVGMTRPHLWSMTLALWAMCFVLERAPWKLFLVSTLWALSYTAPHVAIGFAVIGAAAGLLRDRRLTPWPTLAAVCGVLAGWLLHPHFPSNFIAFKVQIVDVLRNAWGVGGPELHLGGELKPAKLLYMVGESTAVVSAMALTALARWRLRPRSRLGAEFFTLAGAALVFIALTLGSKRFVEYSYPLTLWACALVLGEAAPRWREVWPRLFTPARSRYILAGAVALVLAGFGRSIWKHQRDFGRPKPSVVEPAATWLRENTPPWSLVFTCDWDDAPELFFFDERNRYLVFLDPNFMYRWKPEIWALWSDTANGRGKRPAAEVIRNDFGARYGYCSSDFVVLRRELRRDPRVRFRVETKDAFVFEILDEPSAGR